MKDRKFTITLTGSFVIFILALIVTLYNDAWEGMWFYFMLYVIFGLPAILVHVFKGNSRVSDIKKLKGKDHG